MGEQAAERNAERQIAQRHAEIDERAEAMHIFGTLNFDAEILNGREQRRNKQRQRNEIGHLVRFAATPADRKRQTDRHEAEQDHTHQQELNATDADKQRRQILVAATGADHPMHTGSQQTGEGGGHTGVILLQLRADGVDGDGNRADTRQNEAIHRPVDLIHQNADEDVEGIPEHLLQQRTVKLAENKRHLELFEAVGDIQHAGEQGEKQGQRNHHHRAEADEQQGDHDKRV